MSSNNYTLDRFEGPYAIFLKRPAETEQLIIHQSAIHVKVRVGDIVAIRDNGQQYHIEVLRNETAAAKSNVANLLQQLRNKQ